MEVKENVWFSLTERELEVQTLNGTYVLSMTSHSVAEQSATIMVKRTNRPFPAVYPRVTPGEVVSLVSLATEREQTACLHCSLDSEAKDGEISLMFRMS